MSQAAIEKRPKKHLLLMISRLQRFVESNQSIIDDLRVKNCTLEHDLSGERRQKEELQKQLLSKDDQLARAEAARDQLVEVVQYALNRVK